MRPTNIKLMLIVAVAVTVVAGCSERGEMLSDEAAATTNLSRHSPPSSMVNKVSVDVKAGDDWYHHLCERGFRILPGETRGEWLASCTCPSNHKATSALFYAVETQVLIRSEPKARWLSRREDNLPYKTGVAATFYWYGEPKPLPDFLFKAAVLLTCEGPPPKGFVKRTWPAAKGTIAD